MRPSVFVHHFGGFQAYKIEIMESNALKIWHKNILLTLKVLSKFHVVLSQLLVSYKQKSPKFLTH